MGDGVKFRLNIGSAVILFTAAVAIGIGAMIATAVIAINKLKIGGALYEQVVLGKDLIADILPPPAYVIEAYLVSGEYDYLLRVAVKDTRDYERLLRERLYKIKGIRHSKSSFVLRTLKKADLPI